MFGVGVATKGGSTPTCGVANGEASATKTTGVAISEVLLGMSTSTLAELHPARTDIVKAVMITMEMRNRVGILMGCPRYQIHSTQKHWRLYSI
jgi:hypothetical protein